jgi:hypothetical protein
MNLEQNVILVSVSLLLGMLQTETLVNVSADVIAKCCLVSLALSWVVWGLNLKRPHWFPLCGADFVDRVC